MRERSAIARGVLTLLIAGFSAGWLGPAYAAVHAYIGYLEEVVDPRLKGVEPMTSFDFLFEVGQWSQLALLWLGAVVTFWSGVAAWRLLGSSQKGAAQ